MHNLRKLVVMIPPYCLAKIIFKSQNHSANRIFMGWNSVENFNL